VAEPGEMADTRAIDLVQADHVSVYDTKLRPPSEQRQLLFELGRQPCIISIEKRDVFAAHLGQRFTVKIAGG
jgi:hypothetical protein